MNRGRYYSIVMPLLGIAYVALLIISDGNGKAAVLGALVFAVAGVIGATVIRPGEGTGRERNRNRNR